MRVSIALVGDPLQSWCDLLEAVEAAGFDSLGIPDSQSVYDDVYVRCALASQRTEGLRFGPFVTNPLTRSAATTAAEMSELAALAGSRVFLGIGTADSAAASIGRSPATIAETESYVEAVRCELGRFRSFRGLRSEGIPVYVAAVGRKALRLAGRVGDGVIIGAGTTPEVIDASLTELARGAEEAGRDVTDIDVWWYMLGSLAHTEIEAEKDLRNSLTSFANAAFHLTLDGKEVPDQFKRSIERITSEYNPMHHAKHGGRHHSGLVDDKALREYLLQRFAVCGSPLSATTRLREIEARGVQNLWLAVRTPDKRKFVRLWGKVGSTKSLVET